MDEEQGRLRHQGDVIAYSRGPSHLPHRTSEDQRHGQPAILLLHGSPGSRRDWELLTGITDAPLDLIAVDRPGYGLSHPVARERQNISGNAELLARLVEEIAGQGVVAVGHSHAGGIALRLALDRPELVKGLVLISSIGTRSAILPSDRMSALPIVGEAFSFFVFRALGRLSPHFIARSITAVGATPPTRFMAESLRRTFQMKGAWRTYVREQRSMITETPELEDSLGRIDVPTLVVWGDQDKLVPRIAALELADQIPGAQLQVLEATGHSVPQERPRELADLIAAFVDRLGECESLLSTPAQGPR